MRIIQLDGVDVGWLQVVPRDGEDFVGSIFIDGPCQRRGIGTEVMTRVLDEGARRGQPVRPPPLRAARVQRHARG